MKALVVGLGSIGMRHARNLKTLGITELLGADPDATRRQRFSSELAAPAFSDLTDGLAKMPHLALICSPSAYHVHQATVCAQAGCHLFIEKPLGVALGGIDDLIQLIDTRSLYAHVGSNWKFHAAFRKMKQLLDENAIGHVTGAQVLAGQWLPDWHPWEDYRQGYSARRDLGGGIVFDGHEFDYTLWLLGPVAQAKGLTARSDALETDTDNVVCACLRLESGALATIHMDYIQRIPRRRYHISGHEGTIEWDIHDGRVMHYRFDQKTPREFATPLGDVNEMYLAQMQRVLDGIASGGAPVTPIHHAARVLDLQIQIANNG